MRPDGGTGKAAYALQSKVDKGCDEMEAQKLTKRNQAISRAMKRKAITRQCPKCKRRGSVMKQTAPGESVVVIRYCRYCDWKEEKAL